MQNNTSGTGSPSKVERIHRPSPPPVQVRLVKVEPRGRFDHYAAVLVGLVLVLTVLVAGGIYTQIFGVVLPTGPAPAATTTPSATTAPTSALSPTAAVTVAPTPRATSAPTTAATPSPVPTLSPVPTVTPKPTPVVVGSTYTVKGGDSLYGITKLVYGNGTAAVMAARMQTIIDANVDKYPSIASKIISPGWVLTIPPKP